MPIYCFSCSTHGTFDAVGAIKDENNTHKCPECSNICKRDYATELKSKVGIDALESNERWSRSMGVMPNQIKEAERLYPGSVYNSRGDLLVSSRQDKLRKMKARGMRETDNFNY